jgi:Aspartyl protease
VRLIRPNRNSSDLGELPPFPWLYAYQEDGPRLGSIVHRPVVPVALVGTDVSNTVYALVDSGCSHVLAAPWLADAAGIDPKASGRELLLGIGGSSVKVEFADASLRLFAPGDAGDDVFVEWQAEVGFLKQWRPTWPMLVGQVGFFDHFTVTMSRFALHTSVEPLRVFDERFGVPAAPLVPDIRGSSNSRYR